MPKRRVSLIALLLSAIPAFSAVSRTDLIQRMDDARSASNLTDESLRPWHLAVNFDLLSPAGKVSEHGKLDELWASENHVRRTFVSPSYTSTETRNGAQTFRTTGKPPAPELLMVLLNQLESPIAEKREVDASSPMLETETISKVALECIMLNPPHSQGIPPLGVNPSFCFDPGRPNLRLFINYGAQQVIRNSIGQFQGKRVALDITICEGGAQALRAHVDQLSTFSPQDSSFIQMATQEMVSRSVEIGSAVAAGRLLTKITPDYPAQARAAHISGAVLLRAIIGKDGHVVSLFPTRSPSTLLTDSALKAVRQWTYEPFRVDGEAVEVQTAITVNYNMGIR